MSEGFANAIIGGASTLIRLAIQSANYVAGTQGWRIGKDGTAELNSATIRGTVSAGGGSIILDSTGLHITGPSEIFNLVQNSGFTATRNPNDGALARLDVQSGDGGVTYGGTLTLTPTTPTVHGNTLSRALVYATQNTATTNDHGLLVLQSPIVNTFGAPASIGLNSQGATAGTDDSRIDFTANSFVFFGPVSGGVVTNRPMWVADMGAPSIPNNSVTALTPVTTYIDNAFMGSGSTVTVVSTDIYELGCSFRFASNATGNRMARILVNGSELTSFVIPGIASFNTTAGLVVKTKLNSGDQVQFTAYQNSGAALSLTGSGNKAWAMKDVL